MPSLPHSICIVLHLGILMTRNTILLQFKIIFFSPFNRSFCRSHPYNTIQEEGDVLYTLYIEHYVGGRGGGKGVKSRQKDGPERTLNLTLTHTHTYPGRNPLFSGAPLFLQGHKRRPFVLLAVVSTEANTKHILYVYIYMNTEQYTLYTILIYIYDHKLCSPLVIICLYR